MQEQLPSLHAVNEHFLRGPSSNLTTPEQAMQFFRGSLVKTLLTYSRSQRRPQLAASHLVSIVPQTRSRANHQHLTNIYQQNRAATPPNATLGVYI